MAPKLRMNTKFHRALPRKMVFIRLLLWSTSDQNGMGEGNNIQRMRPENNFFDRRKNLFDHSQLYYHRLSGTTWHKSSTLLANTYLLIQKLMNVGYNLTCLDHFVHYLSLFPPLFSSRLKYCTFSPLSCAHTISVSTFPQITRPPPLTSLLNLSSKR